MLAQRIIFVLLWMGVSNTYSQVWQLPRATLLKNKISEVRIYDSDSVGRELKIQHFVNDSGCIIKTLHLLLFENHLDTTSIEVYEYDLLNKETYYAIKYSGIDTNGNYYTREYYLNKFERKEVIYRSNFTTSENILKYRKRGNHVKNFNNGKLYAKSVHKKRKNIMVYRFYNSGPSRFRFARKIVYYMDANNNTIKSVAYYSNKNKDKEFHIIKSITVITYNNLNQCIKLCTTTYYSGNEPETHPCSYYEYIKKTD